MKKTLCAVVLLFLAVACFAQVEEGISTKKRQGRFLGFSGGQIGWNNGVPQVILSTETAKYATNDWEIYNWPSNRGGYDMFISTGLSRASWRAAPDWAAAGVEGPCTSAATARHATIPLLM